MYSDESAEELLRTGTLEEIMTAAAEQGLEVNRQYGRYTPFEEAVHRGMPELARYWLDHGAEITDTDEVLRIACEGGSPEIVEILLQSGANCNAQLYCGDLSGYSPLMVASKNGKTEVVRFLLDSGANINVSLGVRFPRTAASHVFEQDGRTALHLAVIGHHADTVQLLLERGAEVTRCHYGDLTNCWPLHIAARSNDVATAKVLIENGADVNARTSMGITPLFVTSAADKEMAALLEEHGATA